MNKPDRAAVVIAAPALAASAAFGAIGIAYNKTWLALPAAISLVIAAAALGAFWRIPGEDEPWPPRDDLTALADATRERRWPPLPAKWTAADWAELEREVRGHTP